MKTRGILIVATVSILLIVLFNVWWGHPRKPSFFGSPIPQSAVIKEQWGYASLAGSSMYIVFTIAPKDLEQIITSRGLKPMELTGPEAGFVGTNQMIYASLLNDDIKIARDHGVIPCKAFIDGKWEGLVYYLLLVGTNDTTAVYHYFKM